MAGLLKGMERGGRSFLRGAFHLIPRSRSASIRSLADAGIRRILVVRLDNRLGNLLLITPFLHALRRGFPGATIDLLVSRAFFEVFHGNPDIDRLIVADKAGFICRPWRFVSFLSGLRSRNYDLSFDMSSSHTFSVSSATLVRLAGSPLRVGYRRGESDRFLNVLIDPPAGGLHEAEFHLGLLKGIIPRDEAPRLWYFVSEEEEAAGSEMVGRLALRDGPIVGVFLGARGDKAWGDRNFLEVAREVAGDYPVLIMGGDREKGHLETIDGGTRGNWRVAPVLPLRRFAALVKQCALFISGDCGPMHLAAALGIPVLAVFTVDNHARYGPLGEGNRVIYDPSRSTSAAVIETAREILSSIPAGTETTGGKGAAS